jgi:hypothetical protein
MLNRIRRLPSPALVISAIALVFAIGGGTFALAINSQKAKKIANKQINKKAPDLKVKHAKKASNAGHAGTADNATNAAHATSADNATTAGTAGTANVANSIGSVTYVKGNVVDAPGVTGTDVFEESDASTATCPAGTVIVGNGTHSTFAGVEVSEATISSSVDGGQPNETEAFFDNFSPNDADDNFVTAVCTAANSVNNPDALKAAKAAKAGKR